ncbi:hypothetical protein OG756_38580 [Streptomyces sp. NBC_01310]|uniref:hypothetical protein n=1 Tax=Streptomyces sp. NBC_01310 TaxID=2903820 RepID=UPI0035B5A014|nr:hypothetical protein OG756_38580 [Streptomyces sp. NBC_01310]
MAVLPSRQRDGPTEPAPDLLVEFGLSYCASTVSGQAERKSFAAIDEARHTEPPGDVLAAMVRSPIYYLRRAVANRHTPPEALAAFVRDPARADDTSHLDAIATNPATPVEILLAWAEPGVRHHDMLKNPALPEPVLTAITECPDTSYAAEAHWLLEVRALRAGTETPCSPCPPGGPGSTPAPRHRRGGRAAGLPGEHGRLPPGHRHRVAAPCGRSGGPGGPRPRHRAGRRR